MTSPLKKRGFNPFRRKTNHTETPKVMQQQQLVVSSSGRELANPSNNGNSNDNSRALVKVDKKNNRPVSMDVKTSKEGKVTTTTTTITRPDGSTEVMTMKTGLPGKAKTPPALQLTNGELPKLLTSNGKESHPRLMSGNSVQRGNPKLLQSNGKERHPTRLSNGNKNLITLANETTLSTASQPKRKMLGYCGSSS